MPKSLSAINGMKDEDLLRIMEEFFDGKILRIVESNRNKADNVKNWPWTSSYGTLAEFLPEKQVLTRG